MRDVSSHILDICQNAITANASLIKITINVDEKKDTLVLNIIDNGSGMDEDLAKKADSPFFTTKANAKIGLGLSLLKEACLETGGSFKFESKQHVGSLIMAVFKLSSIDIPPLGELSETIFSLIAVNQHIDFEIELKNGEKGFSIDTKELKKRFAGKFFSEVKVSAWILDYLRKGINELFGGKLSYENVERA
ncbi:MAG: ATP-binding protein [Eubacteriales bacterium]